MPTNRIAILERSSPKVVDGVIKGVKIIGESSTHGWTYSAAVLRAAMPLYESAPVFIAHPDARERRQGSRLLSDHFGALENVREKQNGKGLYGDLRVKPSHPLAESVLEAVPTAKFGLSHNAVVDMDNKETTVKAIVGVNSVDLVDDPATTKTLFEEATTMADPETQVAPPGEPGDATPADAPADEGSFEDKVLVFMAKVLAYVEPKEAAEVTASNAAGAEAVAEGKGPPKRLTALEDAGEADGAPEPIGDSHNDFLETVSGIPGYQPK